MKDGAVIEAAAKITHVAFHLRGILTHGRSRVTDVVSISGPEMEVLAVAAAVEAGSIHPPPEGILSV